LVAKDHAQEKLLRFMQQLTTPN